MRRLVWSTVFAATLGFAAPASADDAEVWLGIVGGSALLGGDVALTVLASNAAATGEEQADGVMIFQTAFVAPQAVLAHVPLIIGVTEYDDSDDDDDLITGVLGMVLAAWGNSLTIYSSWSLSETPETPRSRLGLSLLLGTNLSLTVGALASFTRGGSREPVAPIWLAVPEMVMGATGSAFGIFKAVDDRRNVPGWIGLSVWSTTIFTHGLVSAVIEANDDDASSRPVGLDRSRPASVRAMVAPTILPGDGGPAYGVAAAGIF